MSRNNPSERIPSLFDNSLFPSEKREMEGLLDELITLTENYRSSESFKALMEFIKRFRFCSPYNAMLVHIQMPGATFVAPASRWEREFGRRVKKNARPLIILFPYGPVQVVFDVSDTEGPPLPKFVEDPFHVTGRDVSWELQMLLTNCRRDRITVIDAKFGSQMAGVIEVNREKSEDGFWEITISINDQFDEGRKFATLVHELAHLYCGHLGTPNSRWWQDRRFMSKETMEFEAEAVSYIVCSRLGVRTPSEEYLWSFFQKNREIPPIGINCVLKTAGLIEKMCKRKLPPRKKRERKSSAFSEKNVDK